MTAVQAGLHDSGPVGPVPADPVPADPVLGELVERLHRSTGMARGIAARIVDEVIAGLGEPLEDFVRRRHRELQAHGERNDRIYARIAVELARRPVRVAPLTERQIRRLVYG